MSPGRLKPHTHPPKLHASTQKQEELISQNIVYKSKVLDFVSDVSNYARKHF